MRPHCWTNLSIPSAAVFMGPFGQVRVKCYIEPKKRTFSVCLFNSKKRPKWFAVRVDAKLPGEPKTSFVRPLLLRKWAKTTIAQVIFLERMIPLSLLLDFLIDKSHFNELGGSLVLCRFKIPAGVATECGEIGSCNRVDHSRHGKTNVVQQNHIRSYKRPICDSLRKACDNAAKTP